MKTNVVKTAIVAVAISFALTSCENDTLNEMETKKPNIEKIHPLKNQNDRELERDLLKDSPIRKEIITPIHQKENESRPMQKEMDVMQKESKFIASNSTRQK